MSLLKSELENLMKIYGAGTDWVDPEWEPITKVLPENRELFLFVLSQVLPVICNEPELGVTIVKWSKCDPAREFLAGDDKDVKEFMGK